MSSNDDMQTLVKRHLMIVDSGLRQVGGAELEAMAAEMFAAQPLGARTMASPPALAQLLVLGSEGHALLATMFAAQQAPHLAIPTEISALTAEMFGRPSGLSGQLQSYMCLNILELPAPVCFGNPYRVC
jgi:hypothetical protein